MIRLAVWFLAMVMVPGMLLAQTEHQNVRGTIEVAKSRSIVIDTREGAVVTVTLTEPVGVFALRRLPVSAIHVGDYIGAATRRGDGGTLVTLEVLVFPEAARGRGEGLQAWDLAPDSSMTNATVSGEVEGNSGVELTLTFKGEQERILVPKDAPVVTQVPAAESDLKPGMAVFMIATHNADGSLSAGRVNVEKDGVKPPM